MTARQHDSRHVRACLPQSRSLSLPLLSPTELDPSRSWHDVSGQQPLLLTLRLGDSQDASFSPVALTPAVPWHTTAARPHTAPLPSVESAGSSGSDTAVAHAEPHADRTLFVHSHTYSVQSERSYFSPATPTAKRSPFSFPKPSLSGHSPSFGSLALRFPVSPSRTTSRLRLRVFLGWPLAIMLGQLMLLGAAWGFSAAVIIAGPFPLSDGLAERAHANLRATSLFVTLFATILSLMSTFFFNRAIRYALMYRLSRSISLASLAAGIKLSRGSLVLNRRRPRWVAVTLLCAAALAAQTAGWATLLTPTSVVVNRSIKGAELGMGSDAFHDFLASFGSIDNLSAAVMGAGGKAGLSPMKVPVSMIDGAAIAEAGRQFNYPATVTWNGALFNISTASRVFSFQGNTIYVVSTLCLFQNMSSSPTSGPDPSTHLFVLLGQGSNYSFIGPTVCSIKPVLTTARVEYGPTINVSDITSTRILAEPPTSANAAALGSLVVSVMNGRVSSSQTLTSNTFGDNLSAVFQSVRIGGGGDADNAVLNKILEAYIKGAAEFMGTVVRTGLSAKGVWPNDQIPATMTAETIGHLRAETIGFNYESTVGFVTLLPTSSITIVSIVLTVYSFTRRPGEWDDETKATGIGGGIDMRGNGRPSSSEFDPTNPFHLIVAASAGGMTALGDFRDEVVMAQLGRMKVGLGLVKANEWTGFIPDGY
ncbi:hypothetical protein EWM64_g3998 [Hericium alpestre]|uniref:Uncharacterized protein n=1 Tax=Hericium alpestre TaxID=135208 RepID=A0A4Z0A1E8_9AGAM|nr:hypothetical protein EWM64_g3998 [Hericium alpestre]